jgi:hypothetical protein
MALRTPVHLINYPCHPLAKYVMKILSSMTVTTNSFVEKKAEHFMHNFKNMELEGKHLG